jgi:hypothetical protein
MNNLLISTLCVEASINMFASVLTGIPTMLSLLPIGYFVFTPDGPIPRTTYSRLINFGVFNGLFNMMVIIILAIGVGSLRRLEPIEVYWSIGLYVVMIVCNAIVIGSAHVIEKRIRMAEIVVREPDITSTFQ